MAGEETRETTMSRRKPSGTAPRAVIRLSQEGLTPEDAEWIYLYCLMRTDLASMNPGKAVAQGMHAANKMVWLARSSGDATLAAMVEAWEGQAGEQGFGTTVTLSVDERQMREAVEACALSGLHAAVVHDPTYPLQDGQVVHLIPLDTCAFVFGPKYLAQAALHRLGLMG